LLSSLQGGAGKGGQPQQQQHQRQTDKPFTTLSDLLTPATTTEYISRATPAEIDNLCTFLPAEIFLLAQESSSDNSVAETSESATRAAIEALSQEQKKGVIIRVLRSPQLQQSLASLTVALRDGGLPMIGEALQLKVQNGGLIKGGAMPLGGGSAVEAFVDGVKRTVQARTPKK
jgi:hypothetical protein